MKIPLLCILYLYWKWSYTCAVCHDSHLYSIISMWVLCVAAHSVQGVCYERFWNGSVLVQGCTPFMMVWATLQIGCWWQGCTVSGYQYFSGVFLSSFAHF